MRKLDEKDLKKAPAAGAVRVKILKFVGTFQPGDIVECDKEKAAHLCSKSKVSLGEGAHEMNIRAIMLDEAKEMEAKAVDMKGLSQHEMAEMGKKNIIPTPKDPLFEQRLANLRKMDQEHADGKVVPPIDGKVEDDPPEGDDPGDDAPPMTGKKFDKKEAKQPQAGA